MIRAHRWSKRRTPGQVVQRLRAEVHYFSSWPIIVFNFGLVTPPAPRPWPVSSAETSYVGLYKQQRKITTVSRCATIFYIGFDSLPNFQSFPTPGPPLTSIFPSPAVEPLEAWTPEEFPRLVILHSLPLPRENPMKRTGPSPGRCHLGMTGSDWMTRFQRQPKDLGFGVCNGVLDKGQFPALFRCSTWRHGVLISKCSKLFQGGLMV